MTSPHVLLVQSDSALRIALHATVRELGWGCTQFHDGPELLEWLGTEPRLDRARTVILADLQLETMSGARMLQELAARGVDVPAIIVSSWVNESVCELLRALGARYVMFTPIDLTALREHLRSIARVDSKFPQRDVHTEM